MSRILSGVLKRHESNVFNIERKLCKTINHKQLLCTYKKSKKYPKGMKLRFNLSLCNYNNKLKDACNNILNHASAGILRNVIIKALDKEVNTLKLIRNQTRKNIKTKTSRENYKLINKSVAEKIAILERNIKLRHTRKQERDHIQPNIVARKRNRRFKKEIIMNKRKEKRKRYRSKKKEKLKLIKQNAPDQNAINLSKTILTEEEKSILIKGPSFVPTPIDINWYDVRKDFTKFASKLRHFTDENQQQQQQQQQPQQEPTHPDINTEETTMNNYDFHLKPKIWKRFRDDIFTLWEHGLASLPTFLEHLNTMDKTGKIKFTMEVAGENGLEFLDLKLKIVEGKIKVDVYAKPTNSFSYTKPSTCFPKNNICNIPKGIALRLRRICDDDDTFDKRSLEYQNYLIARDHKPSTVKKHFSEVKNITRTEARKKQTKKDKVSDIRFITTYNPALPNINKIIYDNLSILYTDEDMKKLFPPNSIKTLYRRGKNLKEILSPSLFPSKPSKKESSITSCDKCDICKNYLISDNKFRCKITGRVYYVRGALSCKSNNVVYVISCANCGNQYVGSAIDFKTRFRIHKSDIKTKKDRCGTARHFNNKCSDNNNPHKFLQVQLIESVTSDYDLEGKLWEREKYWQCQLFTNTHGMNSVSDLYSSKRKGCRKK